VGGRKSYRETRARKRQLADHVGDDDALYTPYLDGNEFKPFVPPKKSPGVARLTGFPLEIAGENIRSSSGEQNDWVEYTYEI